MVVVVVEPNVPSVSATSEMLLSVPVEVNVTITTDSIRLLNGGHQVWVMSTADVFDKTGKGVDGVLVEESRRRCCCTSNTF